MKIFKSMIMIVAVAAIVIGATSAYFSAQATLPDQSFSTGTIGIDVGAESYINRDGVGGSYVRTVTFEDLKPGDAIRQWVTINNTGSLDIGTLTVTAGNIVGDADLLPNLEVSATGHLSGADGAFFTDDWGTGSFIDPWMDAADMLDVSYYRTPAGVIPAGSEYYMVFDFTLPTTVGNDMQGKSVTFDMVFDAEQVI